jgi:DNA repair exonuclease SbcCD nuclease subunit
MRIIHTADWHFGADHEHWPDCLASRRRREREAAVQQILAYAIEKKADYLVVAGDVCDFPEDMPKSIVDGLRELKNEGCVPVLFFTNAWHDGNDPASVCLGQ